MKSVFNKITRVATSSPNLNLNDILDVNTSTASAGEVLSFNGSQWVSITAPGKDRLDQLQDVDVSGLQADSILFYDGEYWIDAQHVLTRLNDVVISNPQNGQALVYDSTAGEWKNMGIFSPTIENPLLQWDAITWNGSYWCNRPSVSLLAVTNFLDYFNISATDVKGDITLTFTPAGQDPHTVFSVGGTFANPRFRLLEVADLPTLTLNNLSTVNIGTPSINDLFMFNGTNWTNTPNANYIGGQLDTNTNPVNMVVNKKYFGSGNTYALPSSGIYNGARVLISSINGGNNNLVIPNGVYFCGATNETVNIGIYSFIEAEFHSTGWELISAGGTITGLMSGILYPYTLSNHSNVSISGPTSGQALAYNGSNWANTSLSTSNISNININAPAEGDILSYNSTSSKWENIGPSRCLPTAEVYILGDGTTASKNLATINTWYIFDTVASTFVSNPSGALVFDSPAIGGLRYTGPNSKYFHTAISVSCAASNSNATYQVALFKNADVAPIPGTYFSLDFSANNKATSAAFHKVLSPTTGDTFYIKIRCTSTNGMNIIYNNVNFVMMACCN